MKSGQALVVVLLILAVASAVGLSAISRSVNEISSSTTQDDSSQALSAAESGIEAILKDNLAGTSLSIGTSYPVGAGSYNIVSQTGVGGASYVVSDSLLSGESAVLFLKQPDPSGVFSISTAYTAGNFTVCWGTVGAASPLPALQVDLYYLSSTFLRATTGFDPVSGRTTNFSATTTVNSTCTGYAYQNIVSIPAGTPYLASFRMLYNTGVAHPIRAVAASGSFPNQGSVYEVQGQSGQTSRRVEVNQTHPTSLGIFDNALYSGSDI